MKIYAFGYEKVVVLVFANTRTNPSCQKLCHWYKNTNEDKKKKNMIKNITVTFEIALFWCCARMPFQF